MARPRAFIAGGAVGRLINLVNDTLYIALISKLVTCAGIERYRNEVAEEKAFIGRLLIAVNRESSSNLVIA